MGGGDGQDESAACSLFPVSLGLAYEQWLKGLAGHAGRRSSSAWHRRRPWGTHGLFCGRALPGPPDKRGARHFRLSIALVRLLSLFSPPSTGFLLGSHLDPVVITNCRAVRSADHDACGLGQAQARLGSALPALPPLLGGCPQSREKGGAGLGPSPPVKFGEGKRAARVHQLTGQGERKRKANSVRTRTPRKAQPLSSQFRARAFLYRLARNQIHQLDTDTPPPHHTRCQAIPQAHSRPATTERTTDKQ